MAACRRGSSRGTRRLSVEVGPPVTLIYRKHHCVEGRLITRVTKVADIFNNLSFSASNAPVMATSKPIIYFQLHCLQLDETMSAHVDLRIGALTVLVHVAPHLRIDVRPTTLP